MAVADEPGVEAPFRQQFRPEIRRVLYTLDLALAVAAALAILDVGETIIMLVSDTTMPGMSGLDLRPIVNTRRPDTDEFLTKPVYFPN